MQQLAPIIIQAVESFDDEVISEFITSDFNVDFPLNASKMTLFLQLMCVDTERGSDEQIEVQKARYVALLKKLKKRKPNMLAIDKFGRNFFHHGASVGNLLGIQFTHLYMNYLHERETKFKIPDGFVIPSIQELVAMKTRGGVTPLMKAAASLSCPTVYYLLEIGADPWTTDK